MPIAAPPKKQDATAAEFIANAGKSRRGRPTVDMAKTKPVSLKLTPDFNARLVEAATRRGIAKAAFCVDAIAAKLESMGL